MQRIHPSLICVTLLLLAGCGEPAEQPSGDASDSGPIAGANSDSSHGDEPGLSEVPDWAKEQPSATDEKTSPAEQLPPIEITLETVDETGYAVKLTELEGKVVLVDFWATWCVPCRKSFPRTVELANRHAEEGLAVISVALDEEIAVGAIQTFLEQQRAELINLRSAYGAEESGFEKFELGTSGIPHYKLYARDGTLVKTFAMPEDGTAIDHDEIEQAVQAELAK